MADDDRMHTSRRRILGVGATVAVGAWVAPAIFTVDAASAQGSVSGGISGAITDCGNPVGSDAFDVAAEIAGVVHGTTVSDAFGNYLLVGLAPDTYDIRITPVLGGTPQLFFAAAVVVADVVTIFNPNYFEGGC